MRDLLSLSQKEVGRFLRVWKQTLIPPVITIVLYLLIFWKFIWDKISIIEWVNYIDFIFPGLLMMSVIMASYGNSSFSFFGSKFQKNIEELFVSPMSSWKILVWFCIWAIARGMCVGWLVFTAWYLMIDLQIHSYFFMFLFLFLTSLMFALAGLLNGLYAKSFDDVNIIPSFIITPLIYLGWVFYSIDLLSPFWKILSQFNPILYMVNGLRYAFIWVSDVSLFVALWIIINFIIILFGLTLYLLKKWYGIRS